MLGIKSERKPDPGGSGKMIEDFWGPSLKLLGDLKFLDRLKTYDKDNISPPIIKRIREKWVSFICLVTCFNKDCFDSVHVYTGVHCGVRPNASEKRGSFS